MPVWHVPAPSMHPRQVAFWHLPPVVHCWLPVQVAQATPLTPQAVTLLPAAQVSPLQHPPQLFSLQMAVPPPASTPPVVGNRHRPPLQTSVLWQERQLPPLPPQASAVLPNWQAPFESQQPCSQVAGPQVLLPLALQPNVSTAIAVKMREARVIEGAPRRVQPHIKEWPYERDPRRRNRR